MINDPAEALKHQEAVSKPFLELWTDFFKQNDDRSRQVAEAFDFQAEAERWRRRWLDAMSQSMDAYMRSPAFLETMKHRADAIIKTKDQVNDFSKEVARNSGIPTASDIAGLFERLRSVEELIVARLADIEKRLDAVAQSLAAK